MPEAIITTDKLSKTFSHGGQQQHVLRNLDLTIEQGSFTVIMGPSGAGKSTLLYALAGLDQPSMGTVTIAGTEISSHSEDARARFRRDHCGFVFQQVHLLDQLSVIDNLMAVGLLTSKDRPALRERCHGLLDLVGLPEQDRQKFPSMLSGGEAQRVAVARALVNRPSVLFADEPTGQLNSTHSKRILDLLTQVNDSGQSIVMVTHDLRTAARGSCVLYLRDGVIQGNLNLGPWSDSIDEATRTATLSAFLSEMGW